MAPLSIFLVYSSLLFFSNAHAQTTPPKPEAFLFPIKKDATTNQYYTPIQIGANSTAFNVVVDLGAKFLWFNSLDYFNAASTYRPILCDTRLCALADGVGCVFCFLRPPVPGCTNNTCSDYALNPFTGTQGYSGLSVDTLRVYSTRGVQYSISKFPFQFSDPVLREGLAAPTAGLIGLGRTRISLQTQLASAFKIRHKFVLCIPQSGADGSMIIGQTAYKSPFQEISESLVTTPLIRNPVITFGNEQIGNFTTEYFIGLKSIRVGPKTLSLNKTLLSINKKTGGGGTSIRTVRPYTGLERSIYKALIKEFVKASGSMNITRVGSVAPFGACFDPKTIKGSKTGPMVPTIDFVLGSKDVVNWRFYGSNTMVRVGDDAMCLAFVEGGINLSGPSTSVVVGGHQMENQLLEFDEANSRLGFSSSLLLHDTSCSKFA